MERSVSVSSYRNIRDHLWRWSTYFGWNIPTEIRRFIFDKPVLCSKYTLGSRGYFFLIDTDGWRRSCVNEEKNNLWSQEYATSFPCEKSVQNLNWVTDWILPCQVVRWLHRTQGTLNRELWKETKSGKSHSCWLARFEMSFLFRWVFPLISDRSVWHNGKNPIVPSKKTCLKGGRYKVL